MQGGGPQGAAGGERHHGVPQDQLQLHGQGEPVLLRARERVPTSKQGKQRRIQLRGKENLVTLMAESNKTLVVTRKIIFVRRLLVRLWPP